MGETIFGAADILLPPFDDPAEWSAYSVIACDQFTSEPEYWEKAEKLSGALSTLDMILPEAYLGTNKESSAKWRIAEKMPLALQKLHCYKSSMVYVERVLPDGGVRRGIVGSIDLEEYDYTPSSASPVRATEKTVVERIPPRVEIRRGAPIELPHVMVFADDRKGMLIQYLCDRRESLRRLYDFDLMLGGVDLAVPGNNAAGHLGIAGAQGCHGTFNGAARGVAHAGQHRIQCHQFGIIHFA